MDKLQQLREPFPQEDIEFRVQQSGKTGDKIWAIVIPYVTNRAIQERLDDVFGWDGWENRYAYEHEAHGAVMCGISVRADGAEVGHGEQRWITKWDGAEQSDIEPVKGGLSNAMKRAAVQFGIGRYLYKLDASFAEIVAKSKNKAKTKDGTVFYWNPPKLPAWALPGSDALPKRTTPPKTGSTKPDKKSATDTDSATKPQWPSAEQKAQIQAKAKAGKMPKQRLADFIAYCSGGERMTFVEAVDLLSGKNWAEYYNKFEMITEGMGK